MKKKYIDRMLLCTLVFLWVYGFLSVVFQPVINDCMVFWSYAKQVHNLPLNFFDAIESVWEIKGLFSRIIYYQLYVLTICFEDTLYPSGQYIYHVIGIIENTLLILFSICFIPEKFLNKKEKIITFWIVTLGIYTMAYMTTLQPEIWGFSIILFSFSLLIRNNVFLKIIGGCVLSTVFFLKTPLILLSGSVFFATSILFGLSFLQTIKYTWPYVLSAIITLCFLILLVSICYPQEIQDIFDASYYQSTLINMSPLEMIRMWDRNINSMWSTPLHIPILLIGVISLILCFLQKSTSVQDKIYLIFIWLFPYIYVVISNCYFIYHFVTFLFPSVITIYYIKKQWSEIDKRHATSALLIGTIVGAICMNSKIYVFFTLFLTCITMIPYLLYIAVITNKYRKLAMIYSIGFVVFIFISSNSLLSHKTVESNEVVSNTMEFNKNNGIEENKYYFDNKDILYLNAGISPIWMKNKTYLRYFYPLPIQRTSESSEFAKSKTYIETKNKILNYDGNIIILDDAWFFSNPHKDIYDFISNNYCIYDTIIESYQGDLNLYAKHPVSTDKLIVYKKIEE